MPRRRYAEFGVSICCSDDSQSYSQMSDEDNDMSNLQKIIIQLKNNIEELHLTINNLEGKNEKLKKINKSLLNNLVKEQLVVIRESD